MQEKEWIERSKGGDEEAFESLMHKYEEKIFYECFNILKDEELAKDMVQETFVHAFRHLSSFRMESRFYTWIYRIARNLCIDLLRKKKYKEQELDENAFPAPSPKEEPLNEEVVKTLHKAIQRLPLKQREVIEMFEIQKMSLKEIAAQLGIPPGTVRSRIFYARKKVREYLEEDESTSPRSF